MIEKSHRQCRRVTVYGLSVFRLYRIQFCQSVNGIGRQGIFYSQQSICSNDRRVGNVHIQTVFTVTDTFQKFSLRIVRGGSITGNGTVIISQSFVIICSCTVSVLNLCGSLWNPVNGTVRFLDFADLFLGTQRISGVLAVFVSMVIIHQKAGVNCQFWKDDSCTKQSDNCFFPWFEIPAVHKKSHRNQGNCSVKNGQIDFWCMFTGVNIIQKKQKNRKNDPSSGKKNCGMVIQVNQIKTGSQKDQSGNSHIGISAPVTFHSFEQWKYHIKRFPVKNQCYDSKKTGQHTFFLCR